MSLPIHASPRDKSFSHSSALTEVIHTLEDIVEEFKADGFEIEAASLKTTIDDLQWQYEDVIDKELQAQWPKGPRRPARARQGIR
jgi:hypothetical protein